MNDNQLNEFIKLCVESMDKQELISFVKHLINSNNTLEDEVEVLKEKVEDLKEKNERLQNTINELVKERYDKRYIYIKELEGDH